MDISEIERDVNLSEKGVWVTGAYKDLDLLIASSKNSKYTEMLRKELKPYERQIRQNLLSDEKFLEVQNKCLAHTVLLGWRNMKDKGTDVPYSREKAVELLSNPKYVDFRELVLALADEAEVFRKESVAETTFQA